MHYGAHLSLQGAVLISDNSVNNHRITKIFVGGDYLYCAVWRRMLAFGVKKIAPKNIVLKMFKYNLQALAKVRAKSYTSIVNIYQAVALQTPLNDHFFLSFQVSFLVFSVPTFQT